MHTEISYMTKGDDGVRRRPISCGVEGLDLHESSGWINPDTTVEVSQ